MLFAIVVSVSDALQRDAVTVDVALNETLQGVGGATARSGRPRHQSLVPMKAVKNMPVTESRHQILPRHDDRGINAAVRHSMKQSTSRRRRRGKS